MGVVLGPAGIPLSCKGRTIVEGLEDIIGLGLETMEVQTVRMISPGHFEQYWQAGVLANKAEFQMNIHGPYYAEILGERVERNRTLMKMDATLQATKTVNARPRPSMWGPTDPRAVGVPPTSRSPQSCQAWSTASMRSGTMMRTSIRSSHG